MNTISQTSKTGVQYYSGKWGAIFVNIELDKIRITRRGKNNKGVFVAKEWVSLVLKPDGRIRIYLWCPSMGLKDITYTEHPTLAMMYIVRKAGLSACDDVIYNIVKNAISNLLGISNDFCVDSLVAKIRKSNFKLLSGQNIDWKVTSHIPYTVRKGLVMKNYESACKLWFGSKNKHVVEAVKSLLQPREYTLYGSKTAFGVSGATFALIDYASDMSKLTGWGDLELQLLLRYVPQEWINENVKELFKFLQYDPTKIAIVISRALRSVELGRHLNSLANKLEPILEYNPNYKMLSSDDFNEDSLTIEGEFTRIRARQELAQRIDESSREEAYEWAPSLCRKCKYFSGIKYLPCGVHPHLEYDCNDYYPK